MVLREKIIYFLTLSIFISGCASIARIKGVKEPLACVEKKGKEAHAEGAQIQPPRKGFSVGEKLTYRITWIGVPVGTITSQVKEITKLNGKEAYHIELTVKTNAFCSAIYRIDDKFVTYMDTGTLLPLRHELKRCEGRHRKEFTVEYDHTKNTATYHNLIENRVSTMNIPSGAQDPLSALYFSRTRDVKVGDEIYIDVNMNEKNYQVYGKIKRKMAVEVPEVGRFEAFESEPIARLDGKPVEKGRAWGYISCDESRIPLFGVVDVWVRLIGRVAITLSKAEKVS